MNEEAPKREFWRGCGIGLGMQLTAIVSGAGGLFMFTNMGNLPQLAPILEFLEFLLALSLCLYAICLTLFFIPMILHAFFKKRFYFGFGLLSLFLIPLLFLGVCTNNFIQNLPRP